MHRIDAVRFVEQRDRTHIEYGRDQKTKVAIPASVEALIDEIDSTHSNSRAVKLIHAFIEQETVRIHAQVEAEIKGNLDMVSRDKVKESMQEIERHMHGKRKIDAIKEVRSISGMYLKEAKEWVEGMYRAYSQYDSNPAAAPAAPAPVADSEVGATYLVMTKAENIFGSEAWIIHRRFHDPNGFAATARRQAEAIAKDLVRDESDEVKLLRVIGETKPVFVLAA